MRSLELLLGCWLGASVCSAQQNPGVSADAGRRVVREYLTAELSGLDTSEATRIYGCRGGYEPSTDFVVPVASAAVLDAREASDSARVRVVYRVLGRAYLGSRSNFTDSVFSDTVAFAVVRDSTGKARVGCGPHAAEHRSVRSMSRFIRNFDVKSRRAWRRALAAARAD